MNRRSFLRGLGAAFLGAKMGLEAALQPSNPWEQVQGIPQSRPYSIPVFMNEGPMGDDRLVSGDFTNYFELHDDGEKVVLTPAVTEPISDHAVWKRFVENQNRLAREWDAQVFKAFEEAAWGKR